MKSAGVHVNPAYYDCEDTRIVGAEGCCGRSTRTHNSRATSSLGGGHERIRYSVTFWWRLTYTECIGLDEVFQQLPTPTTKRTLVDA